ncbi:unnamed protein product, partial [Urochloa humidicola]
GRRRDRRGEDVQVEAVAFALAVPSRRALLQPALERSIDPASTLQLQRTLDGLVVNVHIRGTAPAGARGKGSCCVVLVADTGSAIRASFD